jgi:uncharacterized phage protein gp47/JayE
MAFQRDFNELLNEILTAYKGQFPEEVTEGSVLFIKASCTASMLWGLYQTMEGVANQIFVSTADRAGKELHAAEWGIPTVNRSDAQIVDDVIAAKRNKLAGGNRYDYVKWAQEVTLGDEHITHAQIVPLARGEGTFDIVVVGSQNNGRASNEICTKIYNYIQPLRPVGSGFSWGLRICPATPYYIPVIIRGAGTNWNEIAAKEAIIMYINSLLPRQTLYISQIVAIMHENGADTAEVQFPNSNTTPSESLTMGNYTMFRADDIEVVS